MRILVDSSSDYTIEERQKRDLIMIPLHVGIGDKHYRDGIDFKKDEFYDMLLSEKEFPKTSQPSPNTFLDEFEKIKEAKEEVICILLSSALSGTYQSAKLAKDMCDYDGIYLIDSLSATIGIRILVEEALKMKSEGKSAKEIVDKLESIKGKLTILAGVDTLEYLAKGGRVSKTVAAIGGIANIKPVITVSKEGKVEVIAKKRGTSKLIEYIKEKMNEYTIDYDYPIYSVYTKGEENTQKLEESLDLKITERVQLGPTIGAHIGPRVCGLVFIAK